MKKVKIALAVTIVLFFSISTANIVFSAPRELNLASFAVTGSPWVKAMKRFAKIVNAKSKGSIKVLVYPDAVLGDMTQTLMGMRTGSIDMAHFDVGVSSFMKEYRAMQIAWCPYLFKSKEACRRVMNSKMIFDYIKSATKKSGMRIFAIAGNRSPRAIETVRGPIMKPSDLKGMKLRMPGIPIFLKTAEVWGAKPTPLGMSEIYMALKQGVVEGQDNGFDLSIPPKFYEVAKYWSATDHVFSITGWYINEKVWQSLTKEQRKIFIESANEAGRYETELVNELDKKGVEILKKAGCTYVVPDRDAFRKATANIPKLFEGKIWPKGWVQKIKAMQKKF